MQIRRVAIDTTVAAAARIELFLIASERAPFNTFEEFLNQARTRPGHFSYGSAGNGTAPHIAPTAWFILAVNNFNPYSFE